MDLITLLSAKGARELLLALERFPKRQFTISGLAKTAGVPFSTAWNIVRDWERAGIVDTGRVGRAVTVRLSGSQVAGEALKLIRGGVSPQMLAVEWLRGELPKEKAVMAAYLFGSVAKGRERLDSDIDLAVLARKGFEPGALSEMMEERFRAKLVTVAFTDQKELEHFLEGKGAVRLK